MMIDREDRMQFAHEMNRIPAQRADDNGARSISVRATDGEYTKPYILDDLARRGLVVEGDFRDVDNVQSFEMQGVIQKTIIAVVPKFFESTNTTVFVPVGNPTTVENK